ncbi:fructose-1,6-bisphosphate aldolase [Halorubrum sp. CBA1125]|uniref:class I fructose-bisphosphate aldolase n=1 Tax=Halorubrum sp. CBA1125 TaxID=2668072 RepID=UPI0012E964CB|nr:fructose-1,6-bisphosphate aldolase [Halorubrum sp. CBA1125]MUW13389.1 fructose-1,6-bisphosphate aldolase [Halorubrum sp. CBA1125]
MTDYDLLATESGNAVVVAMDHGLALGAAEGFENPGQTLSTVLQSDPDGVLVGPHFARRFRDQLVDADVDVVLTADVVTFSRHPGLNEGETVWTPAFDTELLLDLDPAGVKALLVFGREDPDMYQRNIEYVASLAEELRGTGVPFVVEPVLWGPRVPDQFEVDPDLVANAQRMAWEYGADILKAPYTGTPDSFSEIVDNSPVPLMILGGPASGSTRAMLQDVAEAIEAGARGVMIGRSIWQTDDPAAVVSAMNEIVHEGASVDAVWDDSS